MTMHTPPMLYDFSKPSEQREAFISRNQALRSERSTWHTHYADLARHLLPRSHRSFTSDRNRTSRAKYNAIYDNTGTRGVRTLGSGMQAGASNPGRPWFKLSTQDPDLADFYPVRAWLDDVVERMQRVFARSNTYRTLHQMYEELAVFGTSVSIMLPDPVNVIHHYPVVCGEYCLQKNYRGEIVALYREFQKTIGETVKEFGLENCSTSVRDSWINRNFEETVDILHVIEPREDQARDPSNPSPKNMPFKSAYIELNSQENDKILRESGFPRFPVLAPRWQVVGQDVYGISPGMEALGDVRQLQQEQLRKGQAIDYMVRPPLQVPSVLKDRESDLFPGGLSYYDPGTLLPFDQVTPAGGVRPAFETRLELDHLLADIVDVRQRIDRAFYADLFLMLALAGPQTRMTATEVAERHEEKLLALGPVLERLHNELLQPMIENTFEIMLEQGLFPPPPPELQGVDITVEFVSILAQAQRAVGSNSIDRFMGNAVQLAQVRPDVLDKINFDQWVDTYSNMVGVPTEMVVDDDTVAALRKARAKAEAAQAQIQMGREQAASARDLSQADTSGQNALTDALGGGTAGLPIDAGGIPL